MNKMTKSIPINNISANDDDQTIQEVLESLDVDIQEFPEEQNEEQYENSMPTLAFDSSSANGPYNAAVPSFIQPSSSSFSLSSLSNDVVNILVVFVVFIIISKVPVERFIYKYVSLQHIPLSELIIKAFFASITFFIIKKLINLI
jgi:hypothetical protein